ncbi:MAG: hypothetical protein IAE82_03585 [Opitutaceae bacterium]|nr:hypothetical protein [Opitutaceae bacterium]
MSSGATSLPRARRALRQTLWITLVAALAYVGIRALPVDRGVLHYDDFGAGQPGALEFCEPGGPQFVPVDRVRSPVDMAVRAIGEGALSVGQAVRLSVRLTAASGKPVTADDLLVVHTRKLHLLVIDPMLEDYQHLHPEPTDSPGEYAVEFTPRRSGEYRVFADFMPRATGRALYAGARLEVAGPAASSPGMAAATDETRVSVVDGYRFALELDRDPPRINEVAELRLLVSDSTGAFTVLEEIMGAPAHVVAFDLGRTGFAHLHPTPAQAGEIVGATPLRFQLSLTDPGTYRLWAQVKIDGRELFAPFTVTVRP